jgi:iron complex outermembrane receptor protein
MKHKRTQLAVAAGLAIAGLSLIAGNAAAQAASAQRVEITGSSIKRVSAEASLPVQTFNQEDIKRSGVTSVTDFIQQLPVMQGFTVAADSVGGGGGGVTTASIHDLGSQYTLVLLNGRRVAPSNSGTTIDLNSIPLAAIERIEVLTDGASALYGADAIAGVVNFILKRGEAPFTLDARYNKPEAKGGEGYNVGVSKGFGNFERDGFTLFASLSHDSNKQLKAAQRDFAKTGIIRWKDSQGRSLEFFNGSSRSVPPNIDARYRNPSATNPNRVSTYSFSPYYLANGDCPPQHLNIGDDQCFFDYTSSVEISPEQERTSIFASADVKLGESTKLFAEFGHTQASILARIAPYPAEFSIPVGHPLYTTYVEPNLTPFQRSNINSVNVKYRLYDLGNRSYDYRTEATHLVAGLEGVLAGWDYNGALTISKQKQLQDYVGGFPLAAKFNQALLVDRTIDPFPYTRGQLPASMQAALNSTQFLGTYNTTDIAMTGADLRGSRSVFKMGGGDAMLGAGIDFRRNSYKVTANPEVANAEILFDDPQAEYNLGRDAAGAYVELLLPVMKTLEFTASARYDTVTGVDDSRSGRTLGGNQSATTFKLSGRFQPMKNFVARGSFGTGFRVGSMLDIAQPQVDFGVTGGSYACPFNDSYDPLGYIRAGYVCDDQQHEVFSGGNPALKPEKSRQWTLGFVYDVADSFSVGVDLWSVSIEEAISDVSERLILQNPAKYLDLYTTKFKSSNNLTYVAIKLVPFNVGKQENQGVDWDLTFRERFGLGRVTAKLAGTYMIKSRYTTPGTSDQWETSLGRFGSNDAVSFRNVVAATLAIDRGPISASARLNYRSGYRDIFHGGNDCAVGDLNDPNYCIDYQGSVKAHSTVDLQATWRASKALSLVLGVNNAEDKDPPLSLRNTGSHQLGYDPRYASPLGRTWYMQASYKF